MAEVRCFYCDARLANIPNRKDRVLGVRRQTRDHLIPRAMLRDYDLSQHQFVLNIVECCDKCNQRKGGKSPLKWMKMVPERVQQRIHDRLVAMGVWGKLCPIEAAPSPHTPPQQPSSQALVQRPR